MSSFLNMRVANASANAQMAGGFRARDNLWAANSAERRIPPPAAITGYRPVLEDQYMRVRRGVLERDCRI
jgi:hypothetical protein